MHTVLICLGWCFIFWHVISEDLAFSIDENNVASNFDSNLFALDSSDSNDDVSFTDAPLDDYSLTDKALDDYSLLASSSKMTENAPASDDSDLFLADGQGDACSATSLLPLGEESGSGSGIIARAATILIVLTLELGLQIFSFQISTTFTTTRTRPSERLRRSRTIGAT